MTPKILIVDGYNFLHRARGGFALGDHPVCFNFFRNFRALVEQHMPTRLYFVIEGKPVRRLAVDPEYKANRKIDPADTKKLAEMTRFHAQKDLIINLLKTTFPISVMQHPEHEADDVIYNIIKRSSTAVEFTVASNDTDFIQLLNEFDHVKLYDPMTKSYVTKPDYDYVEWKAFRGDGSDNIPGIPGVGDVTAERLVIDPVYRKEVFSKNPNSEEIWRRNKDLIKFFTFSDDELNLVTSSQPTHDWAPLKKAFEDWKFQSLLKDKAWDKFTATFDHLWGTHGDR